MCGRFARYSLSSELERYFNAHPASFELQPNYNVAPTQEIPVIVKKHRYFHGNLSEEVTSFGNTAVHGQTKRSVTKHPITIAHRVTIHMRK
jgi:putative SOS response-associated peptidase YedK